MMVRRNRARGGWQLTGVQPRHENAAGLAKCWTKGGGRAHAHTRAHKWLSPARMKAQAEVPAAFQHMTTTLPILVLHAAPPDKLLLPRLSAAACSAASAAAAAVQHCMSATCRRLLSAAILALVLCVRRLRNATTTHTSSAPSTGTPPALPPPPADHDADARWAAAAVEVVLRPDGPAPPAAAEGADGVGPLRYCWPGDAGGDNGPSVVLADVEEVAGGLGSAGVTMRASSGSRAVRAPHRLLPTSLPVLATMYSSSVERGCGWRLRWGGLHATAMQWASAFASGGL